MENELKIFKNEMQILLAYIASREDVLEDVLVTIVGLVHSFVNEV